jgi:hypothetical protein
MEDSVLILSLLCIGLMLMYIKKSSDYEHLDGISVKRRWEGKHGVGVKKKDNNYFPVFPS